MIYLSCQPAIPRFAWEVEVYIHNFIQTGVSPQQIHCVQALDPTWEEVPEEWKKLQNKFTNVNFFFYKDTRDASNNYQPSIQAHILEKHWRANPLMELENVFFHDSDIIFTRHLDFTPMLQDDFWYLSDTISYIGSEYIRSKGERVLEKMCEVAEIDKELVIRNQPHSGGAQKLIKKVPAQYWKDSFDMQLKLWKEIPPVSAEIKKEKLANGEQYHELQHWTMSMWSELWCAWKYGRQTRVTDDLKFMFYTNGIDDWETFPIFHNAGVIGGSEGMFFKGKYDRGVYPYHDALANPRIDLAGYKYYEWVQKVGQGSCLL